MLYGLSIYTRDSSPPSFKSSEKYGCSMSSSPIPTCLNLTPTASLGAYHFNLITLTPEGILMLRVTEPYTLATTLVGFIKVLALGAEDVFSVLARCGDVVMLPKVVKRIWKWCLLLFDGD